MKVKNRSHPVTRITVRAIDAAIFATAIRAKTRSSGNYVMPLKKKHVRILVICVVLCAGLTAGILFLRTCGSNEDISDGIPSPPVNTFTFFDIGPRTRLTEAVREELKSLLGKYGVETKTTIDLTLPGVTNFPEAFPRLQGLHQTFNYLPRQRIEHDTLRLTYRYARKKNVPFDRIRLVFSERHLTPLFISLYSKRDGADFIETIQRKYGSPETIGRSDSPERTLYWQKKDALLIISIVKNRIGFNEYNFGIYYLDNLTALADAEKKAREKAEREKEKTGELAF